MNLLTVDYVEFAVGLTGQLVAVVAYMASARWWTNPVGRFLVTLGLVVVAWYVKGLFSHTHNVSGWNLMINGLIALLMIYWAVTFLVVFRRQRAARRERVPA